MQTCYRPGLAPERDAIGAEVVTLAVPHGLVNFEIMGRLIRLQALSGLGDFAAADTHAAALDDLGERNERPLVAVFTTWYRALRTAATGAAPALAAQAYREAAKLLDGAGMPGVEQGLLPLALLCLRVWRHELTDLPAPQEQRFFDGDEQWGYGKATEWRIVSGGYASSTGAADVWTRVRIPLIAGRPLTGLNRFAIVADSANGLSAPLSFTDWLFIPPGVTMHLHRYPVGDWVRLTAASDAGQDGIGLTEGTLSDAAGRCGTVTQPLLVAPRVSPDRTG